MANPCSVVWISVPDLRSANAIAIDLLENRLAACVNQVPGIKSHYRWKGKIEQAREILLIAKTRTALIPRLIQRVRKRHPYTIPEIISWPIRKGLGPYLRWIAEETAAPARVR